VGCGEGGEGVGEGGEPEVGVEDWGDVRGNVIKWIEGRKERAYNGLTSAYLMLLNARFSRRSGFRARFLERRGGERCLSSSFSGLGLVRMRSWRRSLRGGRSGRRIGRGGRFLPIGSEGRRC
jgi:hypothetical protein